MKTSYSSSWKDQDQFEPQTIVPQRSTVASGSILTAGIAEYDYEKRERLMEDILGEDL